MQKVLQPLYFAREDTRTPVPLCRRVDVRERRTRRGAGAVYRLHLAAAIGTTLRDGRWSFCSTAAGTAWVDAAEFDAAFVIKARRILIASPGNGRLSAWW